MKILKSIACLILALAVLAGVVCFGYSYRNLYVKTVSDNNRIREILGILESPSYQTKRYSFTYDWLGEQPATIAHGFGGVQGHTATNSKEALEQSYAAGCRIFECDFTLLGDEIALLHDEGSGQKFTGLETGYSYDDFMRANIYDTLTPISLDEVLIFLSEHPDMYLITDSKYSHEPENAYVFSSLVRRAKRVDEAILDRMIPQIYNRDMLNVVMSIYPFPSAIFTMYQTTDSPEEVARFCQASGIEVVTYNAVRISECLPIMERKGLHSLVHTVNDAEAAASYYAMGIRGIYTDFLLPQAEGSSQS